MVGRNGPTATDLRRTALGGRTPSSRGRKSRAGSRTGSQTASRVGSLDASDASDDEEASVASADAWQLSDTEEVEEAVGDNWEPMLDAAVEGLGEKRGATREKALGAAGRLLAHVYMGDALEGRRVTLLEALRRGVRSPKSARERELSLRAVTLWFVQFGTSDEAETEFGSVCAALRVVANNPSEEPAVRAAALDALAMANFVAGADYRDAAELVHFVRGVLEQAQEARDAEVVRAALAAAGLLLTVVLDGNENLGAELFDSIFDAHVRALTAASSGTRVAAAQNLATMHEALGRFERHDEVIGVLELLRHESSRRSGRARGRRDVGAQRVALRDVLKSLETGEVPVVKLAVGGRMVQLNTWPRILRLQAFRAALGGGLPEHFARNELLHDVFEVEFDPSHDAYLANRARVVVDPSSSVAKARSVDLRRRRDARRNAEAPDED
ncbi:Interferon- developmental regulator 1 [Coemansia sp. RSA 552]|nr:Interferon- developmental regulator 1 [Coemansia sp. RSA 552]